MTDDTHAGGDPTRRRYLLASGSLLGSGLLAGCLGGNESTPTDDGTGDIGTETPATTAGGASGETATEESGAGESETYSVSMAPMGEVTFESVPERVYTGLPNTADMAVAAGQADAVEAVYYPEYHGTMLNHFYERLPGVRLDWQGTTDSWNLGLEGFYELDCDVHLTDPAYASTLDSLDADAVSEIRERIAPWFGNYYSDRHREPPDSWAGAYQHYGLWEIFERVAGVFRAGDRAGTLAEEHGSLRSTIDSGLPPASERPSVGLVFPGEDDTLWAYRLNDEGFLTAHTRPLGATDAFAEIEVEGAQRQIDYETLVAADPDVLLVLFSIGSRYSIAEVREQLADHPVARQIAAVQDDRVYAQGARYQGPLMHLFQLEMTAKQCYPDAFGAWPGYEDGEPYPDLATDEQLFDRQHVADAITGS